VTAFQGAFGGMGGRYSAINSTFSNNTVRLSADGRATGGAIIMLGPTDSGMIRNCRFVSNAVVGLAETVSASPPETVATPRFPWALTIMWLNGFVPCLTAHRCCYCGVHRSRHLRRSRLGLTRRSCLPQVRGGAVAVDMITAVVMTLTIAGSSFTGNRAMVVAAPSFSGSTGAQGVALWAFCQSLTINITCSNFTGNRVVLVADIGRLAGTSVAGRACRVVGQSLDTALYVSGSAFRNNTVAVNATQAAPRASAARGGALSVETVRPPLPFGWGTTHLVAC
jgi:hypothetical protein